MIGISHLSYSYPNSEPALKDINLQIESGEVVLLAGPNGGGKSTLLKILLGVIPEYTGGLVSGKVTFRNKSITTYKITDLAGEIGIVLQDPESQVSNLTVWEETTFGLCNLKFPKEEVIARSEVALQQIGISNLKDATVTSLSGGQLQRLSIASLIAMQPKVLILDEPLANLDPLGVASVVNTLKEIRKYVETMIIATHWLDPFLDFATRVVVINSGTIVKDIPLNVLAQNTEILTSNSIEIPHVIQIQKMLLQRGTLQPVQPEKSSNNNEIWRALNISYVYPTGEHPIHNVSFSIAKGSKVALVGHNGMGKTTLAKIVVGLRKPNKGSIKTESISTTILIQKPSLGFITNNVTEELTYGLNLTQKQVNRYLEEYGLLQHKDKSPFELSGGEQRRLALAIVFASNPDLVILDEPTAGLDASQVQIFKEILNKYTGTAICITHDPRLVGGYLKEILVLGQTGILFQGNIAELTSEMITYLGYPEINPTVAFAIQHLNKGLPMNPNQLEVINDIV